MKLRDPKNVPEVFSSNTPGPATNFGYESNRNLIASMGVRNDDDAQIIRNAVALDCSKIARGELFIYRGAN